MSVIRTFIAFDTPDKIRREMSMVQSQLKQSNADVKWESENKFHATIKFLGDVDESSLPSLLSSIESAVRKHSLFEISYQSVGAFPDIGHPKVVWIGCENPDGILKNIKNELDIKLQLLGFEIEKRGFHPHITLGRIKGDRGIKNLTSLLEKITFQPHSAKVSEVVVMKSVLRPEGSEYSVIQSIALQNR